MMKFISSNDDKEVREMHSKSDNVKLTSYNNANKVVDELFESLRFKKI